MFQPFSRRRATKHCCAALALLACLFALAIPARADEDCQKKLKWLVDRSLIIVAANVTDLGRAPGVWGGLIPAVQTVRYDVTTVYKGTLADRQIAVDHNVIKGSRWVEKKPPGLSHSMFAPGKQMLLFLQTPKQDIGGDCAVQPYSPALDQQLRELTHP